MNKLKSLMRCTEHSLRFSNIPVVPTRYTPTVLCLLASLLKLVQHHDHSFLAFCMNFGARARSAFERQTEREPIIPNAFKDARSSVQQNQLIFLVNRTEPDFSIADIIRGCSFNTSVVAMLQEKGTKYFTYVSRE